MDIQKVIENIVVVIMDSLEECFNTMTIASGKRLVEVLQVSCVFLAVSILFKLLKLPAFISWQEASIACGVLTVITFIDYVNKVSINALKNKLNKLRDGGKSNEQ